MTITSEMQLYGPIKAFLQEQGYVVKGEIGSCDVMAVRGDEAPVIVELKRRFTLELVLQGVDRLAVTDAVYLAVPRPGRRSSAPSPVGADVRRLCRRLGLGLITVNLDAPAGRQVEVGLDPLPYRPRKDRGRAARLLGEHTRRKGDPNSGGSSRVPIVTAYRQDALRCAQLLETHGPLSLRDLRAAGAPVDTAKILQRDVYGWFERVARGTYRLSSAGRQGLEVFAHTLETA